MLTVAIPKRNKLQNIIVLTPKDGLLRFIPKCEIRASETPIMQEERILLHRKMRS